MNISVPILYADAITAAGITLDHTWDAIISGRSAIRPLQRFPHGRFLSDLAAELSVEQLTALQIGLQEAETMLAYHLADRLISRVIQNESQVITGRTALIVSSTKADVACLQKMNRGETLAEPVCMDPYRLAQALGAKYPQFSSTLAISYACASGLIAIQQATRMIRRGEIDTAIVVGVDVLSEFTLAGFSSLGALSKRPCRPYDTTRDGLNLGEGAGLVVLSKETNPQQKPLARIESCATRNDATHITAPARDGIGLRLALNTALDAAGWQPEDVEFINGHGTATVFNDAMEGTAYSAVFGDAIPPLTSFKGCIGHTLGAAGVIEAALCTQILRDGMIPPSIGFSELGVPGKPIIPTQPMRRPIHKLATVKSGFGGINSVMLLSKEAE